MAVSLLNAMSETGKEDTVITTEDKRQFLKRLAVTDEDILRIANEEQRTPPWYEARKYRLTGSNFGAASGHHKDKNPSGVLQDLLWPGTFKGNAATQYGTTREPLIHDVVETSLNQQCNHNEGERAWLESCGLIVCKEHPWLGVSPDDFVFIYNQKRNTVNVGLAEYKAPFSGKHFYSTCPHYYYDQFQGQMAVARSYIKLRYGHLPLDEASGTWTKFCVFNPNATQINHYHFDEAYWNTLVETLRQFYMNALLPRFILKERGVLAEGEVDYTPIVNIGLPLSNYLTASTPTTTSGATQCHTTTTPCTDDAMDTK